jgi:hypothetical protein
VKKPHVFEQNPFAPIYDLDDASDGLGFLPEHDLRAKLVG